MGKRAALSQEFINDDDDDDFIDDGDKKKPKKPAAKKAKPAAKKAKKEDSDDEDSEDGEEDVPLAEGSGLRKNGEGDAYTELSSNRRVTVRQFKGNTLIDIRETYEKDGKSGLPGKKGISLNPAQWEALKAASDDIDAAIAAL